MQVELPIEYPFKNREEKLLILFLLIVIMLLTIGFFPVSIERKKLIASIPETETNAAFVIDEVYQKSSEIDLLLLGSCTIWWQLYTPYVQEKLSQKYNRHAEVITLGHNHFGSDLMYLILKDLLKKRKVKNLLLPLPKIEDLYAFPHQNSVSWWIYPDDLKQAEGLSWFGHSRILGLNLFTALNRITQQVDKDKSPRISNHTAQNLELGFNSLRSTERLLKNQIPKLTNASSLVHTKTLEQLDLNPQVLLSQDWSLFYKLTLELARQNGINVIFVDSPHAVEFTEDIRTIPGNFAEVIQQPIPTVSIDFKLWQESLPENYRNQIFAGHNLTVTGAQLFTDLIAHRIAELSK